MLESWLEVGGVIVMIGEIGDGMGEGEEDVCRDLLWGHILLRPGDSSDSDIMMRTEQDTPDR